MYIIFLFDFNLVIILGRYDDQQGRFRSLQDLILPLIGSGTVGSNDELQNYDDLLKKIKWLNTTIDLHTTKVQETGECSFDVILEIIANTNQKRLVLIQ
jgi:hypothetical protein